MNKTEKTTNEHIKIENEYGNCKKHVSSGETMYIIEYDEVAMKNFGFTQIEADIKTHLDLYRDGFITPTMSLFSALFDAELYKDIMIITARENENDGQLDHFNKQRDMNLEDLTKEDILFSIHSWVLPEAGYEGLGCLYNTESEDFELYGVLNDEKTIKLLRKFSKKQLKEKDLNNILTIIDVFPGYINCHFKKREMTFVSNILDPKPDEMSNKDYAKVNSSLSKFKKAINKDLDQLLTPFKKHL